MNATTSGLNPSPCRGCPLNMVTSTDAAAYPTSASFYRDNGDGRSAGFISKWACVNRPGYGFTTRYSLPCPVGEFNAGDNWSNCTVCGYGLTTAAPGAGVTFANCGIAAGYGYHSSAVNLCPVGKLHRLCVFYAPSSCVGRSTNVVLRGHVVATSMVWLADCFRRDVMTWHSLNEQSLTTQTHMLLLLLPPCPPATQQDTTTNSRSTMC